MCSKYAIHSRLNGQHNWGGPVWPFDQHENLHFDIEYNIHMITKNYEKSGYGLDSDLLTISY